MDVISDHKSSCCPIGERFGVFNEGVARVGLVVRMGVFCPFGFDPGVAARTITPCPSTRRKVVRGTSGPMRISPRRAHLIGSKAECPRGSSRGQGSTVVIGCPRQGRGERPDANVGPSGHAENRHQAGDHQSPDKERVQAKPTAEVDRSAMSI